MRKPIALALLVAVAALAGGLAQEKPAETKEKKVPLFEPGPDGKVVLFNGKNFDGLDANPKYWRVEKGEIVGECKERHPYDYLCTTKAVKDFRLIFMIRLKPNAENSGIQVRSLRVSREHMVGPQCDAGKGWWGHLYDEHGKGHITKGKKGGDEFVAVDDWNTYEILCVGSKIRTAINGNLCVDLDDPELRQEGVIGFQLHSGGPMELRLKDIELELNPKWEMKTVK